jgi:hypothetical protein
LKGEKECEQTIPLIRSTLTFFPSYNNFPSTPASIYLTNPTNPTDSVTNTISDRFKNFKLPGLEKYTQEQLFFISYARLWCSKQSPSTLLDLIQSDAHSPAVWRIRGVVQNSPEFAEAFQCKKGSPMNPAKKCEVW